MFLKPYDIDQLLNDSPVDRALREPVPDFVETGGDGVSSGSIGSGGLVGNMTVQDGYLQSSNYVANTTGWKLTPTGGDFNFSIQADEVHVPDVDTTANSFHVEADGDTWWGATQTNWTADNENALAYVLKTGVAKFKSITLSGTVAISGIANNTSTDIMLLEKTHNLVFSVTDSNTIAWTSGTVTLSNGRTFSISSGNTGNMAALTYIYIDPAVSSTVLQVTTTYSTAVGANKILIGTAQNNTVTASYIPYGPGQPLVDGANIGALSIVAGNIAASTITAAKMTVSQLSAISADMGSITAGTIVLASGGFLRSGQTAYDTGTGFWIGNDSGTPKFSIGNSTGAKMTWNGTALSVRGTQNISETFTAGEAIAADDAVYVFSGDARTETLESGDGDALGEIDYAYDVNWLAGAFTTGASTTYIPKTNAIRLYLSRNGTITGLTITVSIRSSLTGSDLASSTLSASAIGISGAYHNFTLNTNLAVSPSTTYYVVVRMADGGGPSDALGWHLNESSAGSEQSSTDSGASWAAGSKTHDMYVYGSTNIVGRIYKTDANAEGTDYYENFIGFAPEAISSGSSGYVIVSGVVPDLSGITVGSKYYLSDTAGAIATSAGTNTRKVGIGVSTTKVLITNIW